MLQKQSGMLGLTGYSDLRDINECGKEMPIVSWF
jgi:acetate kinase